MTPARWNRIHNKHQSSHHTRLPVSPDERCLTAWSRLNYSVTRLVDRCDIGTRTVPGVSRRQKEQLKTPGILWQVGSQIPWHAAPPVHPSGGSAQTRSPPRRSRRREAYSTQSGQSSHLPSVHSARLKLEELQTTRPFTAILHSSHFFKCENGEKMYSLIVRLWVHWGKQVEFFSYTREIV